MALRLDRGIRSNSGLCPNKHVTPRVASLPRRFTARSRLWYILSSSSGTCRTLPRITEKPGLHGLRQFSPAFSVRRYSAFGYVLKSRDNTQKCRKEVQ